MRIFHIQRTGKTCHHNTQRGGAMLEAAIVMPFYLLTVLGSIDLMMASIDALKFQFATQSAVRETFTKSSEDRGQEGRKDFFETRFNALFKNSATSPSPDDEHEDDDDQDDDDISNRVTITCNEGHSSGIGSSGNCNAVFATSAIGDVVIITTELDRPWFAGRLATTVLPPIKLQAQGLAVVQGSEDE